ncbi:unnamed protein product [Camellia sinensis]
MVQAKAQGSEHWSSEALVQTDLNRAYAQISLDEMLLLLECCYCY